jgi:adenylate kinase family enzyme
VQRVSVVGNSGSGKTTLARALAARLGVPHIELDARFHRPGWQPTPDDEFREMVAGLAAGRGWVIDGNYTVVRDIVWDRADTVVWIDPPKAVVMAQVTRRTLIRGVRRVELWNGNRESLRNAIARDPERSIVRWAWTRHGVYRERYTGAMADPVNAHLDFVRLRSRRQARRWLVDVSLRPGP